MARAPARIGAEEDHMSMSDTRIRESLASSPPSIPVGRSPSVQRTRRSLLSLTGALLVGILALLLIGCGVSRSTTTLGPGSLQCSVVTAAATTAPTAQTIPPYEMPHT